ncbi:MAG TPA: hypothetical protein VGF95_06030 [Solirubrobacteraceae bacterium]|jgi:heme/copper-type cytochrome/quinol oxidase subunit 2
MPESATASPSTLHAYHHVWSIYMPIAVGVFALVVGVLVVLLVLGARRRHAGGRSEALRVEVVAAQWSWRFEYPNGVTVTAVSTWHPKPAYVPAGVEVQFTGTARDVIHGFWVPRLHFQRQLLPGYVTRFDMLFGTQGSYLGGRGSGWDRSAGVRRAAVVLLAWGAWIGAADSIQAIFGPRQIQFEMLGCASAASLLLGLGLWALDARRVTGESPRLLADSSFATAVLVVGLVLALLGAGFGLWLIPDRGRHDGARRGRPRTRDACAQDSTVVLGA